MLSLSFVLEIVITQLELKLIILFPLVVRDDRLCFSLTVSSLREGSKGCFLLIALPLRRAELDFIHFYLWQFVEMRSLYIFILISVLNLLI